MRVELILPWKWTLLTKKALAVVASGDRTPELCCQLVNGIPMAIEVRHSREGLRAPWPIAANPFVRSAPAKGHVIMNSPCEEGRGVVAYLGKVLWKEGAYLL